MYPWVSFTSDGEKQEAEGTRDWLQCTSVIGHVELNEGANMWCMSCSNGDVISCDSKQRDKTDSVSCQWHVVSIWHGWGITWHGWGITWHGWGITWQCVIRIVRSFHLILPGKNPLSLSFRYLLLFPISKHHDYSIPFMHAHFPSQLKLPLLVQIWNYLGQ